MGGMTGVACMGGSGSEGRQGGTHMEWGVQKSQQWGADELGRPAGKDQSWLVGCGHVVACRLATWTPLCTRPGCHWARPRAPTSCGRGPAPQATRGAHRGWRRPACRRPNPLATTAQREEPPLPRPPGRPASLTDGVGVHLGLGDAAGQGGQRHREERHALHPCFACLSVRDKGVQCNGGEGVEVGDGGRPC